MGCWAGQRSRLKIHWTPLKPGSRRSPRSGGWSREQILSFFDGFDLVEPGLVSVHQWRPLADPPGTKLVVLGGVGVKR
jgi:hypothetical protein